MPPEPVPADPGWDEDLAWLDRDPERETRGWTGPASTTSRPSRRSTRTSPPSPRRNSRRSARPPPMSCSPWRRPPPGRRGPGSPARRGSSPASRPARRPRSARGWSLDVLPGCAQLAVSADAAAGEDDAFAGVSEGELIGVLCAWDRVEAHAAARKLAAIAELARRNPKPEDAEFTADELANALAESRARADEPAGHGRAPGHPSARHPGRAARRHRSAWPRPRSSPPPPRLLDEAEARAAEDEVLDRAARLTPGGAARRDRPRRDGSRPGEGEGTPGDRGEVRPGGAVGRGLRQRRPDGPRAPPGRGAGRGPADHRLGEAS